ncbi:hypothetical protein HMPREF3208_01348 [Gardnerella vaginalis]|uniref:Uncharacterized protein n=1 Tax=Gardnerella vaginalis TaxID=2702 RepID=A0A133NR94_GARVA|nr:hypothetical protein HMPREF3208_01348 [Gardnerella vaginalis]
MCADDLLEYCDLVRMFPRVCGLGWGVSPQKRATFREFALTTCLSAYSSRHSREADL